MKHQWRIVGILCLVAALLTAPLGAQQSDKPAPTEGERALAERFVALAQESLRQGRTGTPVFEQAAALIQAATRLDPKEQRYWRLLAEALAATGESAPTRDALTSLVQLNPTNASVYVELMRLYLADMETLDAKLAYLVGDVQKPGVVKRGELPAQVRSAAAAIAAQLSMEQGSTEQAALLVERALELNPVNPDAAELNWLLLQDSEDEVARTKAIMTLVQARPREVQHLVALARQLGRAGFMDASLTWFGYAAGIGQQTGTLDPQVLIPEWAAAMFVTNNPFEANNLVTQLLTANPNDIDGWFMRLLLDRSSGNNQGLADSKAKARDVLIRRLQTVRAQAGVISAEAAENASAVPDLTQDLQKFQAEGLPAEGQAAYASAVHDLLWFELYFNGPSDTTARLLEFLRGVLPADSAPLARLEGWNYLLQGQQDEARVKLEAVADREPLAAVGLLRMVDRNDDDAMRQMTEQGRKLLSENASGLIGAFLVTELRPYGVRAELPEASKEIAKRVNDFTRDWPQIYENPNQFYQIRARVLGIAHPLGKPMIAEVEIKNVSGFDLSIDDRGAIGPNLWFDARLSGVVNQDVSGVAIDRMMQGLVLPARQTMVQRVRLDQPALQQVLMQFPQISIQIMFSVTSNPTTVQNEQGEVFVVPGPVGQRREFQNLIERVAMPVQNLERQVNQAFQQGDDVAALNAMDLIRAYMPVLGEFLRNSEQQGADPQQIEALRLMQPQLRSNVNRQMQSSSRVVRAWAGYTMALLSSGDEQAEYLRQMRTSDDWATRMLSLVALQQRPPEQVKEIAARLTGENEDQLVRRLAQATIAVVDLPVATQPAEDQNGAAAPPAAR